MLSHQYRLRIEEIANKIENKQEVSLADMIWCEKLCKSNRSAAEIVRKARRIAVEGKGEPGSLGEFLQIMNLGDPDPSNHISHFESVDDIANFFHNDDEMRRD